MNVTAGKLLSLLVAGVYVVAARVYFHETPQHALSLCALLALPLGLIWFPERFGNYTGFVRGGYIDQKTPPVVVSFMGWFFLVAFPAIVYFLVGFPAIVHFIVK